MNLLTDDEINTMADEYLENYRIAAGCALNFGRDVEQAVLSKLAAGVSVEPITELIYTSQGYYTLTQLNTAIAAARVQENERCAEVCDDYASDKWSLYKGRKPYDGTEQGRADPDTQGHSDGASACADAIRALIGKEST